VRVFVLLFEQTAYKGAKMVMNETCD